LIMNALDSIIKKARKNPKKIVFPEALDERILKASEIILKKGIARVTLLGDVRKILKKIDDLGLNLRGVEIINHLKSKKFDLYAERLFELRKDKGISLDDAKKMLKDELYFGTMMLHCNDADGLIGGALHSTADTIRAAFQIIKTKKGIKKVSGAMLMIKDEKVLLFADCAVISNPNSEELAEIAMLSIKTFENLFNKKAKAGMLSYSTMNSGKGENIDRVKKAVKIALKKELNVVGEIQADAALIENVCKRKCPQINCKEKINVLVFPGLNSSNISYKLVERLGNVRAIGPILQGLKKPMNDLSRGCSVQDIVDLTAITLLT